MFWLAKKEETVVWLHELAIERTNIFTYHIWLFRDSLAPSKRSFIGIDEGKHFLLGRSLIERKRKEGERERKRERRIKERKKERENEEERERKRERRIKERKKERERKDRERRKEREREKEDRKKEERKRSHKWIKTRSWRLMRLIDGGKVVLSFFPLPNFLF